MAKKTAKKAINTTKVKRSAKATPPRAEVYSPPQGPSKSLAIADPMAIYLAEIRKYPLLSPEDEKIWAHKYFDTKDPKAAEMLVTSNLRFVVKIAAEYSKFGAKMIDLVQEGNVGLMHAVREYNPYKGARLITYAVWWIRGYIQEFLMRQYSLVRMGTTQNQRKLFYQLQKEKQKLEALGRDAGIKLLSSKLGISEEEVDSMEQRMSRRDVSLDQPLDSESSGTFMDVQSDANASTADELLEHDEELKILKGRLESVRHRLNDKELFILENRILSESPLTLQEVGDKFGITRERARQIENRVMEKLKKSYSEADTIEDEFSDEDVKEVGPLKSES
jgi:RNA polymerase sigma-32 factor